MSKDSFNSHLVCDISSDNSERHIKLKAASPLEALQLLENMLESVRRANEAFKDAA